MTAAARAGPADRSWGRAPVATLLALLGWLLLSFAWTPPAAAHAVLLASEPADGQELGAAPAEVVLRFSERVEVPPQAIQVFDASGQRVDVGDARHGADQTQLRAGLPGDLGDGFYTVTWRAVSTDTHSIRGAFTFTVGDPGDIDPVALDDLDGGVGFGWEVAAGLARWVTYCGVLLAAGGVAFLLLVHDRRREEVRALQRVVVLGAVAGVAGTVAGIPLHAALTTGLGWQALMSAEALGSVLASGVGQAALLRVAGLGLLVAGLPRLWSRPGDVLTVAGALAALAAFLLAGHTALSEPRALVLVSNFVHTAAAATWFGGLVLLGLVLRRRGRLLRGSGTGAGAPVPPGATGTPGGGGDARPRGGATAVAQPAVAAAPEAVAGAAMVRRFSAVALACVLALTAGGLALAWVEVRSLEALVATTYGWTLLAKVALVAGVVAVAAYNRRRLVARVTGAADAAWDRLTSTVRLEAVGLVAVLGVTAALVVLVPARTAAGIGEPYVDYLPLGGEHQVNVVIDPARTGRNEIHLYLLDGAGQLADLGEEVTVRLSLPEAGVAPIERSPFAAGPGHWLHAGPELSIPGRWRLEVRVLVSEFERLTATTDVDIGGRAR